MFLFFKKSAKGNKDFKQFITKILGVKPKSIDLYQQAFLHKSFLREEKHAHIKSNERLEFLGDAVLDHIVAEYLYLEFPNKDEGYLTQLKARIVNGTQLNDLAKKLGLEKFIQFHQFGSSAPKSLYGDVMEALIGALYLDHGFKKTRKVVLEKILIPNLDLKLLAHTDSDFKSRLLIWSQRNKKKLVFQLVKERSTRKGKFFEIAVLIDGEEMARSEAQNKREAEKMAAEMTLRKIDVLHE